MTAGACALIWRPAAAPVWVLVGLATTGWPLVRGWRGVRGTALGSALYWGIAAIGLGLVAQLVGWEERFWAGLWTYLSALAALATVLSVFNARRPGLGVWAFLMGVMVLLFLLPVLERSGHGPPRLDAPWDLFFGLLALAGVTNYLPTRYGPASLVLGAGLALEWAVLAGPSWPAEVRARSWSAVPWVLAVAVWLAEARSGRGRAGRNGLERLWFWFRDHWGVVWALRVQERFNRSAESSGWPIRLSWHGVVGLGEGAGGDNPEIPEAAEATLKGLLRRFADRERIDAEAART